jgi:hypothetical protein
MSTQVSSQHVREDSDVRALANEILEALKGIRYGAVEITVHDSRVVQIDRRERFRVQAPTAGKQAA